MLQSVLDLCPHDRLKDGDLTRVSQACKDALALSNTECDWDMFYDYNYYGMWPRGFFLYLFFVSFFFSFFCLIFDSLIVRVYFVCLIFDSLIVRVHVYFFFV